MTRAQAERDIARLEGRSPRPMPIPSNSYAAARVEWMQHRFGRPAVRKGAGK